MNRVHDFFLDSKNFKWMKKFRQLFSYIFSFKKKLSNGFTLKFQTIDACTWTIFFTIIKLCFWTTVWSSEWPWINHEGSPDINIAQLIQNWLDFNLWTTKLVSDLLYFFYLCLWVWRIETQVVQCLSKLAKPIIITQNSPRPNYNPRLKLYFSNCQTNF